MKIKTYLYLLCTCLLTVSTRAQKDTGRFKLSAWQIDLATPIAPNPIFIGQSDLKNINAKDTFLNSNLVGYEQNRNFSYYRNHFILLAGMKLYFQKQTSKGHPEWYIGCKYGQTNIGGSHYSKTLLDSSETYFDTIKRKTIFKTWNKTQAYSFSIWDNRVYLPFGANLKTDDATMFWMNFGVEFCPIFSFGQKFTSAKTQNEFEQTSEQGSTVISMGFNGSTQVNSEQKIKRFGLGMYVACPLNFYFQPFVKLKGLAKFKGLNLGFGVTPLYLVSKTSYLPMQTDMRLNYNMQIRWQLAAKG